MGGTGAPVLLVVTPLFVLLELEAEALSCDKQALPHGLHLQPSWANMQSSMIFSA